VTPFEVVSPSRLRETSAGHRGALPGVPGGKGEAGPSRRDGLGEDLHDGEGRGVPERPTLVLSHNKTLAAQLYQEFKGFFPKNRVEYFVSYYDYYQPEAYVPQSDTYIEKETDINEEIDKLRISATAALFERRDVLIVASVSCIYGLGSPESFGKMAIEFEKGRASA